MKLPAKIVLVIVGICAIYAIAQYGFMAEGKESDKEKAERQEKVTAKIISSTSGMSTLTGLIKTAGLYDTLSADGSFTIFAPTDDAFASLGEGEYAELVKEENKAKLKEIISGHILPKAINSYDLEDMESVESMAGTQIRISTKDDTLFVNDAAVLEDNIGASNGVIFKINKVMQPASKKPQKGSQ
jgi:uncharacterized surface protein with fasciclin (FAS1) repeats